MYIQCRSRHQESGCHHENASEGVEGIFRRRSSLGGGWPWGNPPRPTRPHHRPLPGGPTPPPTPAGLPRRRLPQPQGHLVGESRPRRVSTSRPAAAGSTRVARTGSSSQPGRASARTPWRVRSDSCGPRSSGRPHRDPLRRLPPWPASTSRMYRSGVRTFHHRRAPRHVTGWWAGHRGPDSRPEPSTADCAGIPPRAGPVGDLVPLQPRGGQQVIGELVLFGLVVGVGVPGLDRVPRASRLRRSGHRR